MARSMINKGCITKMHPIFILGGINYDNRITKAIYKRG